MSQPNARRALFTQGAVPAAMTEVDLDAVIVKESEIIITDSMIEAVEKDLADDARGKLREIEATFEQDNWRFQQTD